MLSQFHLPARQDFLRRSKTFLECLTLAQDPLFSVITLRKGPRPQRQPFKSEQGPLTVNYSEFDDPQCHVFSRNQVSSSLPPVRLSQVCTFRWSFLGLLARHPFFLSNELGIWKKRKSGSRMTDIVRESGVEIFEYATQPLPIDGCFLHVYC